MLDLLIYGTIAFLLACVAFRIIHDLRRKKPGLNETWSAFAKKMGGRYDAASQTIAFSPQGRAALLTLYASDAHSPSGARVEIDMRGHSPGALFLFPETFLDKCKRIFEEQDQRLGDEAFDRDFLLRSHPPDLARRTFGDTRREKLISLIRKASYFRGPRLELTQDRLVMRLYSHYRKEESVGRLVDLAHELVGAVLDVRSGGDILWTTSDAGGEGQCRICGFPMKERIVSCEKCDTRHHGDCWEYVGGCSIYGCGSHAVKSA